MKKALTGSVKNTSSSKKALSKSLNFKIEGNHKLSGTVKIKKSKNAAVALLCASLINKGTTTLKKIPKIEEVFRIIEVLKSMGVRADFAGADLIIETRDINIRKINTESVSKTRSAIMMIGALAGRFPKFDFPPAGGCKLGTRSVTPHFNALKEFGITIDAEGDAYKVNSSKLVPADFIMDEMSDTATEHALIAAATISGTSIIRFASSNYMVQDLCHFLVALGVEIKGIGTPNLSITGNPSIDVDVAFEMSEDPIEAMFFIASAAVTESSIVIEGAPIDFLALELQKLSHMGFKYKILKRYIGENGFANLVDIKTFPSKFVASREKIHALPYPGINMDNLPFFVPIAAKALGETLIHDWVFEKRAIYYTELEKLGASIVLADPHRAFITGPADFRAAEIVTPSALRPAAIILITMLAAKGTSILRNVYSINRGYEDLANRLNALGAKIEVF